MRWPKFLLSRRPKRTRAAWRARFTLAGVPAGFLDVIEHVHTRQDILRDLFGSDTTRVVDLDLGGDRRLPPDTKEAWTLYVGTDNDVFLLLLEGQSGESRFVLLDAEEGVVAEYGDDAQAVLTAVMVDLYEIEDLERDKLRALAREMGVIEGDALIASFEAEDAEDANDEDEGPES